MSRTSAYASKRKTGQWHTCQAKLVTKVQHGQPSKQAMIHQHFMITAHYAWQLEQEHILVFPGFHKATVTECYAEQAVTSFEQSGLCIPGEAYCCSVRFEESRYTLLPANPKYTVCHASVWAIGNL